MKKITWQHVLDSFIGSAMGAIAGAIIIGIVWVILQFFK